MKLLSPEMTDAEFELELALAEDRRDMGACQCDDEARKPCRDPECWVSWAYDEHGDPRPPMTEREWGELADFVAGVSSHSPSRGKAQ